MAGTQGAVEDCQHDYNDADADHDQGDVVRAVVGDVSVEHNAGDRRVCDGADVAEGA
jgi:hypothetical protein